MERLDTYNLNLIKNNVKNLEFLSDFLIIFSPIDSFLEKRVKNLILPKKRKNEKLIILLKTNGGSPDVFSKIVDFLRDTYKTIDFYIMEQAMSAGTMFCMAGDNIYMSNESCLGPIDPQVVIDGKFVPAQSHLRAWKNLRKKERLSQAEALICSQKFIPAELELCKQASKFSIKLVQEWLAKYKFASWAKTREEKRKRAEEIAKKLDDSKKWKSTLLST